MSKFIFPCAKNDMIMPTDDDIVTSDCKHAQFYSALRIQLHCWDSWLYRCILISLKENIFIYRAIGSRVVNQLSTDCFLRADQAIFK